VSESITWTVQYQENVFDDIFNILSGLKRDGQQTKGSLNSFLRGSSAQRKNNAVEILEDIDYIEASRKGNTTFYKITENGQKYLNSVLDPEFDEKHIFHLDLYNYVIHYSYAYDYIIENDFYDFEKQDFIEKLVLSTSHDFGTRLYDWKSAEYVLGFMKSLNVISKSDKRFILNEKYRKVFDEIKFINLVEESLEINSPKFTKILCEELIEKSDKFMTIEEPISIESIYKKILKVNDVREFLKFIPGLSRPPIPTKHTLIELK
jgi:hypothetical protein